MKKSEYSKKKEYNEQIKPLVKNILLLCEKNSIPAFMTFAIGNNKEGTDYVTEVLSPGFEKISLTNDEISKHVLVKAGFDLVPFRENPAVTQIVDDETREDDEVEWS